MIASTELPEPRKSSVRSPDPDQPGVAGEVGQHRLQGDVAEGEVAAYRQALAPVQHELPGHGAAIGADIVKLHDGTGAVQRDSPRHGAQRHRTQPQRLRPDPHIHVQGRQPRHVDGPVRPPRRRDRVWVEVQREPWLEARQLAAVEPREEFREHALDPLLRRLLDGDRCLLIRLCEVHPALLEGVVAHRTEGLRNLLCVHAAGCSLLDLRDVPVCCKSRSHRVIQRLAHQGHIGSDALRRNLAECIEGPQCSHVGVPCSPDITEVRGGVGVDLDVRGHLLDHLAVRETEHIEEADLERRGRNHALDDDHRVLRRVRDLGTGHDHRQQRCCCEQRDSDPSTEGTGRHRP